MTKKQRHAYRNAKKRILRRIKNYRAEQLESLRKYKSRLKNNHVINMEKKVVDSNE